MTPTKTQTVYWTSAFGEIPVAEDKLAAKSDVIDYVSSTDIEVHAESRMIGDAAGLGAFEKILRRLSELDGKVTALRGENTLFNVAIVSLMEKSPLLETKIPLFNVAIKNGSTIIGLYRLQYDVVCHAFKKTYGYRYKEIPQVVPEEVVHVFDMRSNLMHLHYWNRDTSKIRESRRDNLKQRCDEILKIWFSGTSYSREQTEIKLKSMIRDYWRDDKEP
ncbi:uncharacterized protein TRUGW13939_02701 [Talaromyces rugulosus]|uniref:Uncharacterized protein n=1 Tax=Talaromyces rugulosus TaxID=121627 RepID=A0A7H8QQ59_TALRU|nr:uncharacterized protein TRUGW13939_02701 [Talaromyces rugulosus]QKX55605.1 hypothetical protein TRUGW13939_02701 [Talaromyces rugulosus]